jgi:predicted lactoylglutathione lyase
MYIPTGGFGWVTGGRPTAGPDSSECMISLQLDATAEVDAILGRVEESGGAVASEPEQRSYGYTGTFTDPDGHLWEAIVSDI